MIKHSTTNVKQQNQKQKITGPWTVKKREQIQPLLYLKYIPPQNICNEKQMNIFPQDRISFLFSVFFLPLRSYNDY